MLARFGSFSVRAFFRLHRGTTLRYFLTKQSPHYLPDCRLRRSNTERCHGGGEKLSIGDDMSALRGLWEPTIRTTRLRELYVCMNRYLPVTEAECDILAVAYCRQLSHTVYGYASCVNLPRNEYQTPGASTVSGDRKVSFSQAMRVSTSSRCTRKQSDARETLTRK